MPKKAIIAGASGLIGSQLTRLLIDDAGIEEILLLVRKTVPFQHKKLTQKVINFDEPQTFGYVLYGDVLFCCLGTTRKKTPDLREYTRIDRDYPVTLARMAKGNGIGQFHFVSSVGADAASKTFYTRTKGEAENDLKDIGLPALFIYQPSILTGNRNELRLGERFAIALMQVINPFLIGRLKKYRSIPAQTVASAMYKESLTNKQGVFVYPSDQLKQLA
jgi:uncharacterized protein YbjT (DUF2867 family)